LAYVNTPTELAKTIVGMSYTGLMEVARQLVDMNKPETGCARDVETEHGMADTLADWARQARSRIATEQGRTRQWLN
jgi:hypothetical protein